MYKKIVLLLILPFLFFSCKKSKDQVMEKTHQYTNSLINESSPYLLQHAHNPVDWHAWNEETL